MTKAAPDLTADILRDIRDLVECESPSRDRPALDRCADVVAAIGIRLFGAAPQRIESPTGAHLLWRFGADTRVLVLAHYDTVWPLGSLERHPFALRDGIMTGAGCFDMKAGLAMGMHAIAALADRRGVALLVTADEEIGSPGSRDLIEAEARGIRAALVLEPAVGPALKTERKGVSFYDVEVRGRAAHAGLEPELGVNATVEMAHQIHAVARLSDPESGTTVTPTTASAGSTPNTVPDAGAFRVDVRARPADEQHRGDAAMRALAPVRPGAPVTGRGGLNRPPLDRVASQELLERAQRLARDLGLPLLTGVAVGGGSDGNFTASVGTPTLDGLGAVGGGAHADSEHVLVAELAPRGLLLGALIADLLAGR